jgi:hypothetical protein
MIANLKDLVVRIENAELIGQYQTLHDATTEYERLNEEIGMENAKQSKANRKQGSQRINAMIQKFAEL